MINLDQVRENKWLPIDRKYLPSFLAPIRLHLLVYVGEFDRHRGIDNDVVSSQSRSIVLLADPFDHLIQLKEQLLGTTETKRWDQRHSAILQGIEQDRLQALNSRLASLVQPIPISALKYQ